MPSLVAPVVAPGTLRDTVQPVLVRDELLLRPFAQEDVADLSTAYADPQIRRWHCRSMTPDEASAWIAERCTRWSSEIGIDWAVTVDGTLVGRVGLRWLNLAEGEGEVAYWVPPAARRRAIASRALDVMTTWCLVDLGLERLELIHSTDNEGSCRVATRADFQLEGIKRRGTRHTDGRHDMHLHARIAPVA